MKKNLEIKGLRKSYGVKTVVSDISFSVDQGQVVGLIGPNGAGKTTAFYMTMGLIKPDKGTILFQGKDVSKLPIHKRAKLGMGYLSQEPSVFQKLSVEKNLLCILETLPLSKKERLFSLEKLLDELSLKALRKERASNLSGGERRRLEITRSLITNPSILLLDEPFANIDPIAIDDLKKLICHLKEKKISILITDHNIREVFSIVDKLYLMINGKIIFEGTKEELMQDQKAKQLYLGANFTL